MEPPNGRGDENQKLLVDNASWDEIAQTDPYYLVGLIIPSVEPLGKYHQGKL
jgi:hypothetical protein